MEIKNWTYYIYNCIINIQEFDSNLIKIDKKSCKYINIYFFWYITIIKIDYFQNIYSVNPLYLIIGKVGGDIECNVEKKMGADI